MDKASQSSALSEQKPSFWLLHILGWLTYVLVFSLDNIVFGEDLNKYNVEIIGPLTMSASIAAILTLPLRYLFQRCWCLRQTTLIAVIVFCSVLVAAIWTPLKNIVIWMALDNFDFREVLAGQGKWKEEMHFSILFLFKTSSYSFFMVLVWCCLYFGINYHYRLLRERTLHLEAARLSHLAQIKMLRYQINPHFLFNTLNAVSTLVLNGSKDRANSMLAKLSREFNSEVHHSLIKLPFSFLQTR